MSRRGESLVASFLHPHYHPSLNMDDPVGDELRSIIDSLGAGVANVAQIHARLLRLADAQLEKQRALTARVAALGRIAEGLDERERALDAREANIRAVEQEALEEREAALGRIAAELEQRERALDAREANIQAEEATIVGRYEALEVERARRLRELDEEEQRMREQFDAQRAHMMHQMEEGAGQRRALVGGGGNERVQRRRAQQRPNRHRPLRQRKPVFDFYVQHHWERLKEEVRLLGSAGANISHAIRVHGGHEWRTAISQAERDRWATIAEAAWRNQDHIEADEEDGDEEEGEQLVIELY